MSVLIKWIQPCKQDGTLYGERVTDIPEPSAYKWLKADISGQGAGRTITSDAWKNLVGKARTIDLKWSNRPASVISRVMQVFDCEYAMMNYFDLLTGSYETKMFYMGDMDADVYTAVPGQSIIIGNASLKCIQSRTDKVR